MAARVAAGLALLRRSPAPPRPPEPRPRARCAPRAGWSSRDRYDTVPPGRRLRARDALRAAEAVPKVRAVRRRYPQAYVRAYLKGRDEWQVSFYTPPPAGRARAQGGRPGAGRRPQRAREEAWTGVQVAWTMARGYPGAFGRAVNAPWVWIGLCALFVLPFLRPPLRLLHLDLAVLLAFSISYAFFGAAELGVSVPERLPAAGVPARAHAAGRPRPAGVLAAPARRAPASCWWRACS